MIFTHALEQKIAPSPIRWSGAVKQYSSADDNGHVDLSLQFGNKATNLITMQTLLGEDAEIPAFLPISHDDLFRQVWSSLSLQNLWEEFKKAQGTEKGHLTKEAKDILQKIRHGIEKSAAHCISTAVDNWLKSPDVKDRLIMVRSSGREDGSKGSNSGGNESINSVPANNPAEVQKAILQVIQSYFSDKSLEQRLLTGDDIFQDPFMPVLLQVMESEALNGAKTPEEVYTSGVGFFREAEGHTEQVLHLQSTFGHGEGVVNSRVPADTFHVGPRGKIDAVIRIKWLRLAPKQMGDKNQLHFFRNTNPKAASLTEEQIIRLKRIAVKLRAHYGEDVDFEFTINRKTNTIYMLQVRPIEKCTLKKEPSFIKNIKEIPALNKAEGIPLGIGGGEAIRIDQPDQIIIADSLPAALSRFLSLRDKKLLRAVVVKTWAAATSHEATIFRGRGIPVILLSDIEPVRQWTTLSACSILISPQQGCVVNVKNLTTQPLMERGWFTHPIPKQKTLTEISESVVAKKLDELLKFFNHKETLLLPYEDKDERYTTSVLLDRIGSETDPKMAQQALGTLLKRLKRCSTHSEAKHHPYFASQLKKLLQYSILAAAEIMDVLSHPHDRLSLLYARNSLEAILSQLPLDSLIDADSYASTFSAMREEEAIAKRIAGADIPAANSDYVLQFLKLSKICLNEKTRIHWEQFVFGLAKDENGAAACAQLAGLLQQLHEFDLKEMWLNTHFISIMEKTSHPSVVLTELGNCLQKAIQGLHYIKEMNGIVQRWETQIDAWSDPALFDKLIIDFYKDYRLLQQLFKLVSKESNSLTKSALSASLLKAIDLIDKSIKTVKGSSKYNDKMLALKTQRFSQFVRLNVMFCNFIFNIRYESVRRRAEDKAKETLPIMFMQESYAAQSMHETVRAMIALDESIKQLISNKTPEEIADFLEQQLDNTQFSMNISKFTVETFFTTTHQRAISLAIQLNSEGSQIPDSSLPEVLQHVVQNLRNVSHNYRERGRAYHYPYILLEFTFPLGSNHSLYFKLNYHQLNGKMQINIAFAGANNPRRLLPGDMVNPLDRMNSIAVTSIFATKALGLKYAEGEPSYYNREKQSIEFTWVVDDETVVKDKQKTKDLMDKLIRVMELMMIETLIPVEYSDVMKNKIVFYLTHLSNANDFYPQVDLRIEEIVTNLQLILPEELAKSLKEDELYYSSLPILMPFCEGRLRKDNKCDKAWHLCISTYFESLSNPLITEVTRIHAFDHMIMPKENFEKTMRYCNEKDLIKEKLDICFQLFNNVLADPSKCFVNEEVGDDVMDLALDNLLEGYAKPETREYSQKQLWEIIRWRAHSVPQDLLKEILTKIHRVERTLQIPTMLETLKEVERVAHFLEGISVIKDEVVARMTEEKNPGWTPKPS